MRRGAIAACTVALALAGCGPTLRAESAAPPGRIAQLEENLGFWGQLKSYDLELTAGAAIALTCHTLSAPCRHAKIVSIDPQVAEVRGGSLSVLEPAGLSNNMTMSAHVVIGKTPGKTRLVVGKGKRIVHVTVLPPPVPSPPARVARPAP